MSRTTPSRVLRPAAPSAAAPRVATPRFPSALPVLWLMALALLTLALAGCGGGEADTARSAGAPAPDHGRGAHAAAPDPTAHAHHGGEGAAAEAGLSADEPADFSIYHVQSTWTDQHGARRPLDDLAGRVQVVGMVYTSCGYACPRMVLDMKRLEDETAGRDVGLVLVTIDPERDTPERLAEFAVGARLDPARWTLLHGDPGDILELAALLGVRYRRMANGEFIHSNLLTVLDREGQVAHRQLGLGADPAPTLATIRDLAG